MRAVARAIARLKRQGLYKRRLTAVGNTVQGLLSGVNLRIKNFFNANIL